MTKDIHAPKIDPVPVVRQTLDGLEDGVEEVLADHISQQVKQGLAAQPGIYLRELGRSAH